MLMSVCDTAVCYADLCLCCYLSFPGFYRCFCAAASFYCVLSLSLAADPPPPFIVAHLTAAHGAHLPKSVDVLGTAEARVGTALFFRLCSASLINVLHHFSSRSAAQHREAYAAAVKDTEEMYALISGSITTRVCGLAQISTSAPHLCPVRRQQAQPKRTLHSNANPSRVS